MTRYMEIYSETKEKIEKGILQPGDKLPAHRELCDNYSTSIATITRAINRLKKEGYVESFRGMGTVVAESSESASQLKNDSIVLVSYFQHFMQDAFSYTVQEVFADSPWTINSRCSHSNLEWYRSALAECHKNPPLGMIVPTMHSSLFQYDKSILPQPCTHVVLLGHEIPGRYYDLVKNNSFGAGEIVAEYLLEKGYQDFVFISDILPEETRTSPCLKGMRETFQCHGVPFGSDRILSFENPHSFGAKVDSFIDSYHFVKELLTRRQPRVIIAGHDYCAVGAIRAIQDAGLSVPEDVAVMSTSSTIDLSAITAAPKITGVDTLFAYRIRLAAEILKSRLEGNTGPVIYRETHGRIREGETA